MRANVVRAAYAAQRETAQRDARLLAAERAAAAEARAERRRGRETLRLAVALQRGVLAFHARRLVEAARAARAADQQRGLIIEGALRRRVVRRERRDLEHRSASAIQAVARGKGLRTSDAERARGHQREQKAALAFRVGRREAAFVLQRCARAWAGRREAARRRRERSEALRLGAAVSRLALKERRASMLLQGQVPLEPQTQPSLPPSGGILHRWSPAPNLYPPSPNTPYPRSLSLSLALSLLLSRSGSLFRSVSLSLS